MTHSNYNNNKFNDSTKDNQPILLIESKSDYWLEGVLVEYDVKVVFDFQNINANHERRIELVTPKIVRDILRNKKLCIDCVRKSLPSFDRNDVIVKLLRFVLRDKAYADLTGVPLVPVLNDSHAAFGDKTYYLTKHSERKLFPKYGPNIFVDDITDQDIKEIFLSEDFQKVNDIKLLDPENFRKILKHELPEQSSLDWNPESSSIPNKCWLNSIWDHILDFDCDLELFTEYPLLPIDKPSHLVALNSSNPLIRYPPNFNNESMVLVLEKMGVRFTNFRKAEQLKPYIYDWNSQNVLRIVEILRKFKNESMDNFLKVLDSKERESFRRFIIDNWLDFVYLKQGHVEGKVQEEFYDIIRLLPIWPTHSKDKTYMSPKTGCLIPKGLVFFSPQKANSNYFDVEPDNEWLILNKLDTHVISFNSYITGIFYHIKLINPSDPDYMNFVFSLLNLPLCMIPDTLARFSFIPNDSYTKFMKASELYDPSEEIFREVFAESDQFLPVQLRNGWVIDGLKKLGFNCVIDAKSLIHAAETIENLSRIPSPPENLRERAKTVLRYFYCHTTELNLSSEAWERLLKINFIPSKPVNTPFLETACLKVSGLHSFDTLCLPKYKNICWTQCPIYDDDVLPPTNLYEQFPDIGTISSKIVIDHLYAIITNIVRTNLSEWTNPEMSKLLRTIILQIYQHLNEAQDIKLQLKDKLKSDPKIFLNGNDPFNPYYWVSGKQLVLNIDEDMNSDNRAVYSELARYTRLLRICEAQEMKTPSMNIKVPGTYSQRDRIAKSFARFLDEQLNSTCNGKGSQQSRERCGMQKFHDIFFNVHGEIIGSNRYVLAASADYFERMFTSGTMESGTLKSVCVDVDDIKPEAFRIMLKWLYGRSLEDAMSEVKKPDIADEISFYLEMYIDLLNACEKYDLQELKWLIEHKIIKSNLIRAQNVLEVKKWAEKYDAKQLISYCKFYKKENFALLIRHRCINLLYLDEDELQEALEDYENEFGNLGRREKENNFWNWKVDAFNEFEKGL